MAVDLVLLSKYASLAGTAMGIGLGITPIFPFIEIIRGKEKATIFPESMIFFNILCPHLWASYWIRQCVFIPFFSAIFGLTLGFTPAQARRPVICCVWMLKIWSTACATVLAMITFLPRP